MNIIKLDRKRLIDIKGLWEELNGLHGRLSQNFKEHFDSFTFEDRLKQLAKKSNLSLFVANEKGTYVGYCIVTSDKGKGEIDSIYIQPKYRGKGIGNELMLKAIHWLNKQNCKEINIYVAEGNELVLGFYEKYGFKKRSTVLQKV
jgi:ribosomal protein S18 acetylase RimI-like enzyme